MYGSKLIRMPLVAAAAAVTLLAQLALPRADYWPKPLLYAAVVLLALEAAWQVWEFAARALHASRLRDYERGMRSILSSTLAKVVAHTHCDWRGLGVHIFLVRGWPFRKLVNVGGLRISGSPSMLKPRWRPGKGVVGRSVRDEQFVVEDWETLYSTGNSAGRQAWNQRSRDTRYGLSWGELQLTADYRRIASNPVFRSDGSVIGCVAIDGDLAQAVMESNEIKVVLSEAARSVVLLGEPPVGWWLNP